jgi:hypothetical protein
MPWSSTLDNDPGERWLRSRLSHYLSGKSTLKKPLKDSDNNPACQVDIIAFIAKQKTSDLKVFHTRSREIVKH